MIDFIQIGANIGNTPQDILWPIIRERGWKGIFVEPFPESFKQLKINYSDLQGSYFENCAIFNVDGEIALYYEPIAGTREIASVIELHSIRNMRKMIVPCMTLETLITKYKLLDVPFELLQIDAERADGTILRSVDFTHILPKYIRFEHIHLSWQRSNLQAHLNQVLEHLSQFGYKKIPDQYDNGIEKGIDTMVERT